MRVFILFINFCLYGIFLFFQQYTIAAENIIKTAPITNNGKKWRIGYRDGGNYYAFNGTLKGVVEGLIQLGWIEKDTIPNSIDDDSRSIWKWLGSNAKSKYLDFVDDAYWSDEWSDECIKKNNNSFVEYIKYNNLDLVIAMGTRAAEELNNCSHKINTLIMSSTNPIASELVKGLKLSGISNVHAAFEPALYKRQLIYFYKEVNFKKLGVVYFDSEHGKIFAGIKDIREVANEYNFKVIECLITDNKKKYSIEEGIRYKFIKKSGQINSKEWQEYVDEAVKECHLSLAQDVDSVYITPDLDISEKNINKVIDPLLKYRISTWTSAEMDWDMVQHGVLMSFNRRDYTDIGLFEAKVMAQIFNGSQPGEISQIFHYPKNESILLNLKTAKLIQFNPSWNVLAAARIYDEIKPSIEKEEKNNDQ